MGGWIRQQGSEDGIEEGKQGSDGEEVGKELTHAQCVVSQWKAVKRYVGVRSVAKEIGAAMSTPWPMVGHAAVICNGRYWVKAVLGPKSQGLEIARAKARKGMGLRWRVR